MEFKDSQAYWVYSGYPFAITTAILRITNYKHWISDVLEGTGLNILVANLVYYFEPLKIWDPFKSKRIRLDYSS
ncbi:phosphatase PAP2 family protein [Bacteroidetes bacterium endosymbiont of Geopemphigus sp.]|uniref:phosphatase PAP2 family protein n=1 Tax=Bacteroidetes bacterium endosymbiont of Geopemphigus sp. TaxID=2047937 RepID=UPI000CD0DC50|nr:phosphatase PAP2 family protein [Bacteroidetes bacterium endosymbiont of Geopemphigus sp.]